MKIIDIQKAIDTIAEEHGWYDANSEKPQTPRNLATSISLEVAELLENFQWSDLGDKKNIGEELADIIIYASQLSNVMNIDLSKEISKKLEINKKRAWK